MNCSEFLRNNNIKPSYIRLKVLEYLVDNKNHPTVDTIYNELAKEIPTLSRTSVYNSLNLFVDKNIVNVLSIEENVARYDVEISFHGHFFCESCKDIFDVEINKDLLELKNIEGFSTESMDIYIRGICRSCKNDRNLEEKEIWI